MRRIGPLLCIVAVLAAAAALSAPAAAQADDAEEFVARQDGECVELATLGDGSRSVDEFYDYRYQDRARYASYGTPGLQQTGVSQVFVYRGSSGTSLVFLHDELGDEAGGGAVSMELSGLPEDGSWPVMDDRYENRDDRLIRNGSSARVDWMYAPNRTDGAAFRGLEGLGDGDAVRIDPSFDQTSYAAVDRNWPWVSGDLDWKVRHGPAAEDLADVREDAPLRIERGSCGGESVEASLSTGGASAAGETATLRASVDPVHADVVEYRWDVDGDGDHDAATHEPRYAHRYWEHGSVEPAVTVVTRDGRTASASAGHSVEGSADLAARIQAEDPAAAGEAVRLDATGSIGAAGDGDDAGDGADALDYEWELGDGATAEGATVEHAYDEPGSYEVRLTVTGPEGRTAIATERVSVGQSGGGPAAALSAPTELSLGEAGVLDASGAASDREFVVYRWDLDGDGSDEVETRSPQVRLAPAAIGEREVAVTVVDAAGETDRATASVDVVTGPVRSASERGGFPRAGWGDADVHTELERTGDGVALAVDRAEAGDRVRATVPGPADEPVALRAVEIELDRAVEDWQVSWSRGDAGDLPSDVAPVYALDPAGDDAVRHVTYRFAVAPGAADVSRASLGVAERRTAWVTSTTATRTEAGRLEVSTSSDALRPLALASGVPGSELPGAPGAASSQSGRTVQLASLAASQREVEPGEQLVVRATYENTGTATGIRDATFAVSGETVAESSVELQPADRTEVEFEHAFERPGTYTVAVDGESRTIRVVEERRGAGSPAGGTWTGGTTVIAAGFVGLLLALAAIGRWTIE